MGEPSLSCEAPSADTYRLTLIPAWGAAETIRITTTVPEAFGTVSHSTTMQGPTTQTTRAIDRDDAVGKLSVALRSADFWTSPTAEEEVLCADGTWWVLEGRSGATYHVVHRACPARGSFRDLGLAILRMAGEDPM